MKATIDPELEVTGRTEKSGIMSNPRVWILLSSALLFSGAAGLINQVVWQRALKVSLGGSETISAMIVVLVFLAGIGSGSAWMACRVSGFGSSSRTLCAVEFSIAVVNILICFLLSADISESIYSFQRLALGIGLPIRWLYASGAFLILFVPCFLMGMTVPLASEVCQRELGSKNPNVLNRLYSLNTLGSVVGSLVGLAVLVPHFGQSKALLAAAALNWVAAVTLLLMPRGDRYGVNANLDFVTPELSSHGSMSTNRSSAVATLAFGFGFCALWYEMFLYRAIAMAYEPLPLVFSTVLTGYLVFWSLGVWASSRTKSKSSPSRIIFFLCIVSEVAALYFLSADAAHVSIVNWKEGAWFLLKKAPYFFPCFFFGLLYGETLKKIVRLWGRDVGWFSAWNTVGACAGIVLATVAGYEVSLPTMLFLQWLGLLALAAVCQRMQRANVEHEASTRLGKNLPALSCAVVAIATFLGSQLSPSAPNADGSLSLYGRDGVIIVDEQRNVSWDGLWHSKLSQNGDHIGTYNWALAIDPILAHPGNSEIREGLVIGVGSGITLGTLAKLETVERIDAYDINQTLKRLVHHFPEGTLHVATNPKVRLVWQDGRSGLALNNQQYDLITQQPLYLKQAGSSILLSKEYFQLVSKRLRQDGIFCVYANGTPAQAMSVRQTASEVFPYMLVLHSGYQVLLSKSPISISPEQVEARLALKGKLWDEIRGYRSKLGPIGWQQYLKNYHLPLAGSVATIRDDFPIVEYPKHLEALLAKINFREDLPWPRFP
jgi:spermidine synthase